MVTTLTKFIKGLFTPTGGVVIPMLLLLGVISYPKISSVMDKFGFETKSSLKESVVLLKEEKSKLITANKLLSKRIVELEDILVDYEDFLGKVGGDRDEVTGIIQGYLDGLDYFMTEELVPPPPEEMIFEEEVVEVIKVTSAPKVKVGTSSVRNIKTLNNAYTELFGDSKSTTPTLRKGLAKAG